MARRHKVHPVTTETSHRPRAKRFAAAIAALVVCAGLTQRSSSRASTRSSPAQAARPSRSRTVRSISSNPVSSRAKDANPAMPAESSSGRSATPAYDAQSASRLTQRAQDVGVVATESQEESGPRGVHEAFSAGASWPVGTRTSDPSCPTALRTSAREASGTLTSTPVLGPEISPLLASPSEAMTRPVGHAVGPAAACRP